MGNVPWTRIIRARSNSHDLHILYFTGYFNTLTHIDLRGKFVYNGIHCPNVYVLEIYQDETLSPEVIILRQIFV